MLNRVEWFKIAVTQVMNANIRGREKELFICNKLDRFQNIFFLSEGGKDDLLNNKALDKNPSFIRLRLSQRVLELQEAVSVTSRKVKLQWEVSWKAL